MVRRKGKANWLKRKSVAKWLETHVWNAKRMQIIEKWGVKMALNRNQRSFRFMYRCSQKEAAIHDASFIRVIELTGDEKSLISMLDSVSDPTIANPGSSKFLTGDREGRTFIHNPFAYPSDSVSPVSFLWKPTDDASIKRTVWIWAHISTLNSVRKTLEKACEILSSPDIIIKPLDSDLIRFELTGPKSHSILVKALNLTDNNSETHLIWEKLAALESSAQLPQSVVISLEINDPRLRFPVSRAPKLPFSSMDEAFSVIKDWPSGMAKSKIWNFEERQAISNLKASESDLNKRRQSNLIPGTPLEPLGSDPKIPIILIQRPDIEGWTLIAHKPWAMPLWQSLIYSGARAGGLRDVHSFHFEAGLPYFPNDYYECKAYEEEALLSAKEAEEKYNRKPISKRVNYSSLKIKSPFRPLFESLSSSRTVIHSPRLINYINQAIELPFSEMILKVHSQVLDLIKSRQCFNQLSFGINIFESCFVRLKLTVIQYGLLYNNAHIYVPITNELQMNKSDLLVLTFCNRKDYTPDEDRLCGFVTTGGVSYKYGKGRGIGCCLLKSISQAVYNQK